MVSPLSWLLLAGCEREIPEELPPPPPELPSPEPPDVRSALAARGMLAASGHAAHLNGDCCQMETCLLANPDNDYLGWFLPRGPGQTEPNPMEQPDGTSHIWRLRADEAVVAIGLTPPPSAYFSYRTYLDGRWYEALGERKRVFSNFGDSLNQLVLGTGPEGPFSALFALVTTADEDTFALVRQALLEAGLPEQAINLEPLAAQPASLPPGGGPFFGLSAEADTFRLNARLSLPEDAAQGEAYLADPPIEVFRVTPAFARQHRPLPPPPLRARGSGTDESAWADAIEALDAAIRAEFSGYHSASLAASSSTMDAGDCPPGCNRDTFFATTQPYLLPPGLDAFVMVYGVNHERTGKSVYSNFSVIDTETLSSSGAVHSRDMVGSARRFLPNHPLADDLYAWRVARTCDPADPYCLAVPSECPGLGPLSQGSIAFRAYVEPATATGPKGDELIVDRAIAFFRAPDAP